MSSEDFYTGYEPEPEFIVTVEAGSVQTSVRSWIGFIDKIFRAMTPQACGWTGLAREYHLTRGWFDESPWYLGDVEAARTQWSEVETSEFDAETRAVHEAIMRLLELAAATGSGVRIDYQ